MLEFLDKYCCKTMRYASAYQLLLCVCLYTMQVVQSILPYYWCSREGNVYIHVFVCPQGVPGAQWCAVVGGVRLLPRSVHPTGIHCCVLKHTQITNTFDTK